jgi:hypothetical protein
MMVFTLVMLTMMIMTTAYYIVMTRTIIIMNPSIIIIIITCRSSSAPLVDQASTPGRPPNTKAYDWASQLTRATSRIGKYSSAWYLHKEGSSPS